MNIFKNNPRTFIPSNSINELINLTDIIIENLRENKVAFIWDICETNKKYSLDILHDDNLYKQEGHIHKLFDSFKDNIYFNISYKLNKSCNLCFNSSEELIKLEAKLPIIANDFDNCFSFVDILYDRFAIKHSICINCSYDLNKNIKKEIKYHIV